MFVVWSADLGGMDRVIVVLSRDGGKGEGEMS